MSSGPDKSCTTSEPLCAVSTCSQFAKLKLSGYDQYAACCVADALAKKAGVRVTPGESGKWSPASASSPLPASMSSSEGKRSSEKPSPLVGGCVSVSATSNTPPKAGCVVNTTRAPQSAELVGAYSSVSAPPPPPLLAPAHEYVMRVPLQLPT